VSFADVRAICFDWGGTLMSEAGPDDRPMALWPTVQRIDGAVETLAALHGRYPLCIATNASVSRRDMIEKALDRAGLLRYIADVFCFTELAVRKESPDFWRVVTEALKVAPGELAMIGDSLEPDVLAPRRFGVQAVWFNDADRQPSPAVAVPTVSRLVDFAALFTPRC
jgi:FMN phosphatase YigB (HAD superfamily)